VLTVTVLPKTARIAAARAAMGLPPHGHAATQSGAPHGHAATQPVRRSGVQGLGTATTLGIPVQHRATVGYGGYGTLPAAYAAAGFTQGTYNGNGPPINAHGLIGVRGKLPNGKQYKRSITMAAGCTLAQAQAIASNPQHPQMAAALAPLAGQRVLIVVHAPAAVAGYVQQAPLRSTAAPSTKPAAPAQPAPL
jgi:hypothetical protein